MRFRHSFFLLVPLVLFVLGCTLPMTPPASSSGAPAAAAPAKTLTVQNDAARNQGVLVNTDGTKVDVTAVGDDGAIVNCVDALGVAPFGGESGARSLYGAFQAVIVGTRGDGGPGAWAFDGRKMQAVIDEDSGQATSRLPECADGDGMFRGQLGWVYHVVAKSPDGMFIAGYAQNPKGISRGRFQVDPGTTIGVYWRISKHPMRAALVASRAKIIGSLDPSKLKNAGRGTRHYITEVLRHGLGQLKLFVLGYFDEYLIMVAQDGVASGTNGAYLVTGTDQDNADAVASIDPSGNVVITEQSQNQAPPNVTPGSFQGTGTTVALGSSLAISLVLTNTQSVQETQGFSVAFYIATGTTNNSFSPTTDTPLGNLNVTQAIGANSSMTISTSFTYPPTGPFNENVYVYAVVTNNVSAVGDAAVVLAYKTPSPQPYDVVVETYPGTSSGSTNTGIALYKDAGGGAVTYVASDITAGSHYGSLAFSGLVSGTYYVVVVPITQDGPFAIDVRSTNIDHQTFAADPGTDPSASNDAALVSAATVTTFTGPLPPPPFQPQPLAVGTALDWRVTSGDQDWFTFTLP